MAPNSSFSKYQSTRAGEVHRVQGRTFGKYADWSGREMVVCAGEVARTTRPTRNNWKSTVLPGLTPCSYCMGNGYGLPIQCS
eukprot:2599751-Prymnesium_polylepis.2